MGYGEVGGNSSVQVSFWIPTPRDAETEEGDAPGVWNRAASAAGGSQLSARGADLDVQTGRAYRAQDTQLARPPNDSGNFRVTVRFENQAELGRARAVFNAAMGTTVEFELRIRRGQAGQIQIEWPS